MPRVLAGRWGPSLAVLVGAILGAVLGACSSGVALVPVDPDPPIPQRPTDPVDPGPGPGPVDPPATVAAMLETIRVGATRAETIAAVGRPPESGPAGGAGPETLRWYVTEGDARYLVWAALEAGAVVRKGAATVEVVR